MNEYTVTWPLWKESGLAERDEFPITEMLARRLERWARIFNDHFSWDSGWDDPTLKEAHRTEARKLYSLVCEELGSDYRVLLDLWEA